MQGRCLWVVVSFLFGFILSFFPGSGFAAEFPTKSINFWIGYNAGGDTDLASRPLAEAAAKFLGQPVVAVNKPGGSGAIMLSNLMGVKPDGYTIGVMTMGSLLASHMRKVPYVCSRDFTPIIHFSHYAFGNAVMADAPWKDFEEYLKWAKENPGKAKYATSGLGGPQHLIMERIAIERNIQLIAVPYTSGHESLTAVLGGQVTMASVGGDWVHFVESGKMRCLVILVGKRMKQFPNVPTVREFGFNFEAPNMIGIVGPKGMSPEVVKRLHDGFKKAMEDPIFVQSMEARFQPIVYMNSEEFGKSIAEADREQGVLIRQLGLRKE